jgi:hypothetical protein
MAAILKCAGVEKGLLDSNERFYSKLGEEWVWKPVRQREDWGRGKGSGLTLIVADDEIIKLGWTSRRGREGASGQKLEVSRIESVVRPGTVADYIAERDGSPGRAIGIYGSRPVR